jgi:hypothetical protein
LDLGLGFRGLNVEPEIHAKSISTAVQQGEPFQAAE